jgi:hypothetical protein
MQTKHGRPSPDASGGVDLDFSWAALFALVWDALAEVLGTAAVAAIVRRAARRAAVECPELVDLVVRRENLEYRYTLPHHWSATAQAAERGQGALPALVGEIGRLLLELTGTVVINRLEQIPELRARGLVGWAENAN